MHSSSGTLLDFGALNAFGGGYYGLAGAQGIPREWLRGSPFFFARWRKDRQWAVAAGVIVLGWLGIETTAAPRTLPNQTVLSSVRRSK